MSKIIGIIFAVLLSAPAFACDKLSNKWTPRIESLELSAMQILNYKNPLLADIDGPDWGHEVMMSPCVSFLKIGYLESKWYFDSAYQKVMQVGLYYDLGVRVTPWLDIVARHHSWHSADESNSFGDDSDYGLKDSIGIKIKFLID